MPFYQVGRLACLSADRSDHFLTFEKTLADGRGFSFYSVLALFCAFFKNYQDWPHSCITPVVGYNLQL